MSLRIRATLRGRAARIVAETISKFSRLDIHPQLNARGAMLPHSMWKSEVPARTPVRVQVEFEVSSWIHGRGVRHTDYSVRVNDAWIPINELRDVVRVVADPDYSFDDEVEESLVIPPGCQYRITYRPRLVVGTRVQRRISVPREPSSRDKRVPTTAEEAFQQLMRVGLGPKLALTTTFTDLRVTRRGQLVTEEQWQRCQSRQRSAPSADRREAEPPSRERSIVTTAEIEAFTRRLRAG